MAFRKYIVMRGVPLLEIIYNDFFNLNYSYLYPAQQSTAIARHAFHFAVVLDDKLQQDEIHPFCQRL